MSLTVEDKRMIKYFLKEKGDITRWSDFKDKAQEVFEEFPLLRIALDSKHKAEKLMKEALREVDNSIYEDEEE